MMNWSISQLFRNIIREMSPTIIKHCFLHDTFLDASFIFPFSFVHIFSWKFHFQWKRVVEGCRRRRFPEECDFAFLEQLLAIKGPHLCMLTDRIQVLSLYY